MEVLDNIPVALDLEAVFKKLNMKNKNAGVEEIVSELVDIARSVARPKAVFEISDIDNKNGDSLRIHGVKFTSRVLSVNLNKIDTVFPYVITCGREIDDVDLPAGEMMKIYFMDQIKEMLVHSSLHYVHDYIREHHCC